MSILTWLGAFLGAREKALRQQIDGLFLPKSARGAADGVAALGADQQVPQEQLGHAVRPGTAPTLASGTIVTSNPGPLPVLPESFLPDALLRLIGVEGRTARLFLDGVGGASGGIIARRANGTAASPTAVVAGNSLFGCGVMAYGATGYKGQFQAFNVMATETWTDTACGFAVTFRTIANGTAFTPERCRIDHDGTFRPSVTDTHSFGSAAYRWANVHAATATLGGLTIGNMALDASAVSAANTLTLPNRTGTVAIAEEAATAAQGAKADSAVQPNTAPTLAGGTVVTNNAGTPAPLPFPDDNLLHLVSADGAGAVINLDAFNGAPNFAARRANGTLSAPTGLTSGNTLFGFGVSGYGATQYKGRHQTMIVQTTEAWTDTACGYAIGFRTVANGTTSNYERFRIDHDGTFLPSADNAYAAGRSDRRLSNGHFAKLTLASLTDADDDAAAAAAGVQVGEIYRSGSQLMVRAA